MLKGKITLSFDGGGEFALKSCQYSVHRDVDTTGRPAGPSRGGQIHITRETSGDSFFWQWSIDNAARKNGKIEFPKATTSEDIMYTLEFENAFITGYSITNYAETNIEMSEDITISAQKMTRGSGATVDNDWPTGT